MKHINNLTYKDIQNIKLLVFDVDGVLVPRGTVIKQDGNKTMYETKTIPEREIELIKQLKNLGYQINISSGRSITMLIDMFREILPYISLTFENGYATWDNGNITQNLSSYYQDIYVRLLKVKHKHIKGFEPKISLITIHCEDRVLEIENIMKDYDNMYCLWNGEAYDIGCKSQTKGNGLYGLKNDLDLDWNNILFIGDNYNDIEILDKVGLSITADKSRVEGKFFIDDKDTLPAQILMEKLIALHEGENNEI